MTEAFRVLVTDDEEGMRLGVERALSHYVSSFADLDAEASYEVRSASSGEEALSAIAESPPDILLLDYKLPGLSGLEVLERLPEHSSQMLTVMITAYASLHTAVEATRSGAYDFLPKPFTPEELKATIRKATRHLILQQRARCAERDRHRARFELISVVSHELKAPLAAVEGYLELLQEQDQDPATRQRIYGRCVSRIGGMRKLIFDLLDLTRIESGQRARELVPVEVCQLLREALEAVRPSAVERHLELQFSGPETAELTADPGELRIVIDNLLSNAVKYNRDGGRVDVSLTDSAQQLCLEVSDTGIGLTEAGCAKLFEQFVRIRSRETQHIPGSGLGLSIVKRIASLYGGEATVKSEPGVGSTFTVTLQRTTPTAPCGPGS